MSFSISPGVYSREIDLSTTIPAVATSIGVNVLRKTYKGPEFEKVLITNVDELIDMFGKPTNTSYEDLMASMGFLKYGKMLYCTRVMPDDATFAGTKIITGDETATMTNYSFEASDTVPDTQDDGPYTYTSLGTTDVELFAEQVHGTIASNGESEPLWVIANSRGAYGNNIRVLVYERQLYTCIKYYDGGIKIPNGLDYTISDEITAKCQEMYNSSDTDVAYTIGKILDYDTPLTSEKQFAVIVQAKDQGSTLWEDVESFIVSSDETEVDDTGSSLFVETVINENSKYIKIALNPYYLSDDEFDRDPIGVNMSKFYALTGGKNGVFGRDDESTVALGEAAACNNAYDLYSNPEEIDVNLFIDANKPLTTKQHLITLCEATRKDCFAILDIPKSFVVNNKGFEVTNMVDWRKGLESDPTEGSEAFFNPNTSYAALYGNWLEVFDSYAKKYRWIPSSGHMAGLYAHTDAVADAWWAPAGLNRAIITGVRKLAFNPTEGNRDAMYLAGINPIVSFAGQGKVVWGQKTLLDKSSAFNRINVRRLFLVMEKAISKASKYFLFEQNDAVTWLLLTNMIEPFLRDIKGRRGLYDFMVIIDDTTNTAERIDRNELWGNILLKPTRSVEFIRLQFVATKTGASFTEVAEMV